MLSGDYPLAATGEVGTGNFFHHTYPVALFPGLFSCQPSEDQAPLIFSLSAAAAMDSAVDHRSWENTTGVCTAQLSSAQPYRAHAVGSQHVSIAGLSTHPSAPDSERLSVPTGLKLSRSPTDEARSLLFAGQQPRSLQGEPVLSATDSPTEGSTDVDLAERDSVETPKGRIRRFLEPCTPCVNGVNGRRLTCEGEVGRRDVCLECLAKPEPKAKCDRPEILRKSRRKAENLHRRSKRAKKRREEEAEKGK